jgi:hypothetical protein
VKRYVLRRLLLMVPTLLGITLLTFSVAQLAPGDPFLLEREAGGIDATALALQREQHGLDAPLPVQFGRWLWRVVRFDFGRSLIDQRPVSEKVIEALTRRPGARLAFLWSRGEPVEIPTRQEPLKYEWSTGENVMQWLKDNPGVEPGGLDDGNPPGSGGGFRDPPRRDVSPNDRRWMDRRRRSCLCPHRIGLERLGATRLPHSTQDRRRSVAASMRLTGSSALAANPCWCLE